MCLRASDRGVARSYGKQALLHGLGFPLMGAKALKLNGMLRGYGRNAVLFPKQLLAVGVLTGLVEGLVAVAHCRRGVSHPQKTRKPIVFDQFLNRCS